MGAVGLKHSVYETKVDEIVRNMKHDKDEQDGSCTLNLNALVT